MRKEYIPHPIDTSSIELPEEVSQLLELIARNVHEVWAANRVSQGWKHGKCRNDELKHHPCLIPYEELSEEEREYDRQTAMGTLKLIQHLGWKIEKQK